MKRSQPRHKARHDGTQNLQLVTWKKENSVL